MHPHDYTHMRAGMFSECPVAPDVSFLPCSRANHDLHRGVGVEVREGGEGSGVRVEREGGRTGVASVDGGAGIPNGVSRGAIPHPRRPACITCRQVPPSAHSPMDTLSHLHALVCRNAKASPSPSRTAVIAALLVAAAARAAALAPPHAGRVGRLGRRGRIFPSHARRTLGLERARSVQADRGLESGPSDRRLLQLPA